MSLNLSIDKNNPKLVNEQQLMLAINDVSSQLDDVKTDVSELTEALADKQDGLTISTVGLAMLNIATPETPKIIQVNADGTISLIDHT